MKRHLLIILITLTLGATISAQVTTRRTLRQPRTDIRVKTTAVTAEPADTIAADTASFMLFGYDKVLRSNWETFFAKNLTTDTVTAISGIIRYTTMQGTLLHKRTFTHRINLPPGETRQINLRSWARQNVWYYHLSAPPQRAVQATPYRVTVDVETYTRPKHRP